MTQTITAPTPKPVVKSTSVYPESEILRGSQCENPVSDKSENFELAVVEYSTTSLLSRYETVYAKPDSKSVNTKGENRDSRSKFSQDQVQLQSESPVSDRLSQPTTRRLTSAIVYAHRSSQSGVPALPPHG